MTTRSQKALAATALFDLRPINLDGGVRLKAKCVEFTGQPTAQQWQAAMQFAEDCAVASPYWVGDLLAYAESREDWREKMDQLQAHTGMARQTLHNLTSISRRVALPERELAPSIAYAEAVAKLTPAEQREFLAKARDEGWKSNELRDEVRAAARVRVIEGQAHLDGQYRIIYADCPWRYRESGTRPDGAGARAERHYPTMSIEELCALPVKAHARPHAVLFAWVTVPLLFENPGPREVFEAWGFRYASNMTWDKVLGIPGRFFQVQHEHLIVLERGSCPPDRPTPKPRSVLTVRRSDKHSEKPEEARRMITSLYTTGPFLELFGREPVEGWTVFGNDVKLWTPGGA